MKEKFNLIRTKIEDMNNILPVTPAAPAKSFGRFFFITGILEVFSSIRLAFFLIFAVITVCAAGTIIAQNGPEELYFSRYGHFAQLIFILSFDDIYHSFIFYFIITLLSLNITICSLRSFLIRSAAGSLKDARFIGVQLVHLSVLVIISGAVLGNVFGYKSYAKLYAGDILRVYDSDYQRLRYKLERADGAARNNYSQAKLDAARLLKEIENTGRGVLFELKIDDFKTEYFTGSGTDKVKSVNSGRVKNWNTYYTLMEEGRKVSSGVIAVNSPLSYKGVDIYQSSYYKTQNQLECVKIRLEYLRPVMKSSPGQISAAVETCAVRLNEIFEFNGIGCEKISTGGDFKIKLESFVSDFRFDQFSREIYSASDYPYNPAFKFSIAFTGKAETETRRVWVFKKMPDFSHPSLKGPEGNFKIAIEELKTREGEASGLQLNYDPGSPVVMAGFFLLSAGFFMSFFFNKKSVFNVNATEEKKLPV